MGVDSSLSSPSALSCPPPVYAQRLVYLVYDYTISCCTVAVYSAMSSLPLSAYIALRHIHVPLGKWHYMR